MQSLNPFIIPLSKQDAKIASNQRKDHNANQKNPDVRADCLIKPENFYNFSKGYKKQCVVH